MIDKNLSYAYPQKFVEGGEVSPAEMERLMNEQQAGDKRGEELLGRVAQNDPQAAANLANRAAASRAGSSFSPAAAIQNAQSSVTYNDTGEGNTVGSSDRGVLYTEYTPDGPVVSFMDHSGNALATFDSEEAGRQFLDSGQTYANYTPPGANPTFTDQVPGYTVGGQEFMGPDMAPQPPPPGPSDYLGSGVTLVENNGGMVSQDALNVLNMAVGLQDDDMSYDANGDGRITPSDAVEFMRYAKMENYGDDSGFMSNFYAPQEEPGMPIPPPGTATTRAVGEEEGMDGFPGVGMPIPPPGTATTMAMGEEGEAPPGIDPGTMPRPKNPFSDVPIPGPMPMPEPITPTFTPAAPYVPPTQQDPMQYTPFTPVTMGGAPPVNPFPTLPTGGQGGRTYGNYQEPAQPIIDPLPPGQATTMAMGEEDGGGMLTPLLTPAEQLAQTTGIQPASLARGPFS
mgnify:CR=1 FL=1